MEPENYEELGHCQPNPHNLFPALFPFIFLSGISSFSYLFLIYGETCRGNEALDRHSFLYNRGNQTMNYQVTWQLDYPGVLVELGYLSNEFDDYILNETEYQDKMVTALIEGINSYVHR